MKFNKFRKIKDLAKVAKVDAKEMDKVAGGVGRSGATFSCQCSWGANPPYRSSWVKWYMFSSEIYSDIARMCRNGRGGCRRIGY